MSTKPDDNKLAMHSPDLTEANIDKLAELFPNCVTEAEDDNGKLKRAIDFDQLRQELSDHVVDGPRERYRLDWPGKREAQLAANAPIAKTLRPCREASVDFDTTQNLFIEGDNLDALKLLQENYLNSVKMIYIDPPYNKGKDFVYRDIFEIGQPRYLRSSEQVSDNGNRMVVNQESDGRFHSKWLSMMLPRLKLARLLLQDNGVMFISIDEEEVDNLEKLCKEVFGNDNVLGHFPVIMNLKGNQDAFGFAETHEYFIACMRSKDHCVLNQFQLDEEELAHSWDQDEYGYFKLADNLRATGVNAPRHKRPNLWYPIFVDPETQDFYITKDDNAAAPNHDTVWPISPDGDELSWYWGRSTFQEKKHNLVIKKTANGWQFYRKQRPALGDLPTKKPKSFFYKAEYSTSTATTNLKNLMGTKIFDGPKPVPFLTDLIEIATSKGDLILDFFAGSGTTAHAAMRFSAKSGHRRNWILVQWPEEVNESSEAARMGYTTISEIAKYRLIRAGEEIREGGFKRADIDNLDTGFRVLKVDRSNMKDVYYAPDQVSQRDLPGLVDNIKDDRSDEDLLFQVLLDWGVDLSYPITPDTIAGKTVYFVDGNALAACFETGIDEDFVKELAGHEPLRAVFRDSGYGSDNTKINVEQIFKQLSPSTEVKTL